MRSIYLHLLHIHMLIQKPLKCNLSPPPPPAVHSRHLSLSLINLSCICPLNLVPRVLHRLVVIQNKLLEDVVETTFKRRVGRYMDQKGLDMGQMCLDGTSFDWGILVSMEELGQRACIWDVTHFCNKYKLTRRFIVF